MPSHIELGEFIWRIADHLRGDYEKNDNEDVILPFTLLRRLDCVLEKNREKVSPGEKAARESAHAAALTFVEEIFPVRNSAIIRFWAALSGAPCSFIKPVSRARTTFSGDIIFRAAGEGARVCPDVS